MPALVPYFFCQHGATAAQLTCNEQAVGANPTVGFQQQLSYYFIL